MHISGYAKEASSWIEYFQGDSFCGSYMDDLNIVLWGSWGALL